MIRDFGEIKSIDNLKYIDSGAYAKVYLYDINTVIKIYLMKRNYQYLLNFHDYDYLSHLKKLEELNNSILVTPDDIFVDRNGLVRAYTMELQNGIKLNNDIGNVKIECFINKLENFYKELENIDYLLLNDASPHNLILGENLKIIDLDYSIFASNSKKENIKRLNYSILKSILNTSLFCQNEITKKMMYLMSVSDIPLIEILIDYIDFVEKNYCIVKYVKDLRIKYDNKL